MKLQLTTRATRLLETFVEQSPKISLNVAYNYVKQVQEMDNDLAKYEFTIMQLFKALGFDSSGYLSDPKMSKHLEKLNDLEVWQALRFASYVHCMNTCGLPTPPHRKPYGNDSLHNTELKLVEEFKESSLSHSKTSL